MAQAVMEETALPALSTVGWFCPPPSRGYAAGNIVPEACPLVLVAARAPLGAMYEDARNDSTLATTRDRPAGVGTAAPSPRCDEPGPQCHVGWSDSPAQ